MKNEMIRFCDIDEVTKTKFAEAFLRTKNHVTAGIETLRGDMGSILQASVDLLHDPFVLSAMDQLKEEKGELSFLPSKADIARDLIKRAEDANDDNAVKLYGLVADLLGYREKPGSSSTNVAVTVAPVMVMKDHGTDEEWQAKAAAQQAKLVLNATN